MRSRSLKSVVSAVLIVASMGTWSAPAVALRPMGEDSTDSGREDIRLALADPARVPGGAGGAGVAQGPLPSGRPVPPARPAPSAPAPKTGGSTGLTAGLEEGMSSPARLASEEGKRQILLEQAQSAEWKDFAAQSLAVGTAPQNFRDRMESFRTGAGRLLAAVPDPRNMTPEETGRVQTLLSSLFYTTLQLTSHAVQIKTLSHREKFGGDALSSEEIQHEADSLLDLLAWAETRFPGQARRVIDSEWQDNLLHLGLADYEKPYGADLGSGKKNLGTTLFSNWAEEAARNGHARLFRTYANFLADKINASNPAEAQMATQEVWGHDYGGITTRLGVLLGVNFVMMNPTLVRRSVWESAEAVEMVRARVRAVKAANAGVTGEELWAHGTFMGGWHARMALYPTFVISRGQEGQVSLQLDPRENSATEILASLDRFIPWLAEEGARFLDRFVVDAEVVSEEQIREAFYRPDGGNTSKINAVFKVDGSNTVNYGDILEKAIEVIREKGRLDLVALGLRTNSLVTRLHGRGIFTNFTAHGRVGIAASLAQWAGNAVARGQGVPVHGGYVTQMAGRLDEFLAESALHLVRQELQQLIDETKGIAEKKEEAAGYEGLLAEVKKLSQGTQGALNQVDAQALLTPLGRAIVLINADRRRRNQPALVIPRDDDVRFFGALVIQRTEKLLTPLRAALAPQGVTVNESAQLLASTRPWEVGGKMVHFFYTTGSSRNIKRGWFPSTGLVPLSRVDKQALRAHLSQVRAAAPGTVVEEVPAGVFDRLADSSLGEIVRRFTEPTPQEAGLFERVAGAPNPLQGQGGLALDKLHTTRFMSFTFTGDYNVPKPTTLQEVEEAFAKGRIKGQFLDDARKYQADVTQWAQPAGAEETRIAPATDLDALLRPGGRLTSADGEEMVIRAVHPDRIVVAVGVRSEGTRDFIETGSRELGKDADLLGMTYSPPAGTGLEEQARAEEKPRVEREDRVRVDSAASAAPGKVFAHPADIPAQRWVEVLGAEPIWLSDVRSTAMGELAVQYGGEFAGEADLAFAAASVVEGDPAGWNQLFREFRLPAPVVSLDLLQGLTRNDLAALAVFLRKQQEGGLVQIRGITIDESKGFRELVIRTAA